MFMSFVEKRETGILIFFIIKDYMNWLFSFPIIILLNTLIILELFQLC